MILTTSLFLVGASVKPFVAIFLATMFFWGIYYELITFARFQFVGSVVPANMRTGSWGIMGTFTNLAYFLGPLIAVEILYVKSNLFVEGVIGIFLFIAFLLIVFSKNSHDAPTKISFKEANPLMELTHWFILAKSVWPAIVLSLLLGFITAFKNTPVYTGDELNADMSSSFGGIPRSLERGGCHSPFCDPQKIKTSPK